MIRIKVQYMEEEIKNYIDYLTFERRNAKNTYNSYKSDLEEYRLFLKQRHIEDVRDIKRDDIAKYMEFLHKEKNKETSIARKLTAIKNFHKYMYVKEVTANDVSSTIERPKLVKHLPNVLTVEEVDRLLDIKPDTIYDVRNKAMLELLYGSIIEYNSPTIPIFRLFSGLFIIIFLYLCLYFIYIFNSFMLFILPFNSLNSSFSVFIKLFFSISNPIFSLGYLPNLSIIIIVITVFNK